MSELLPHRGTKYVSQRLANTMVMIWSGEHQAWWRPNYCGYTIYREAAGIYNYQAAARATSLSGPEKKIMLVPVISR